MQLHLLMLLLAIVMHDQLGLSANDASQGLTSLQLMLWLSAPLAAWVIYTVSCRTSLKALGTSIGNSSLRRTDRLGQVLRLLCIAAYVTALYEGVLTQLRDLLGDLILLDELVMVSPMVLLMLGMWAVYYPIDRRIRQASLIGRIDAGLPIYPVWSLSEYLLAQVRHQLLLIGAPLLLIFAWQETLTHLGPTGWQWVSGKTQMALAIVGSCSVFLLAPVMIRHLWDTTPLPDGELRQTLTNMCERYRVRVREILLWRTFGGLTNAAVMGVVGPVRYVLLSDALLDMLPRQQIEAVMAHELAHIRKHHILSLVLAALATLEGLYLLANPLMNLVVDDSVADMSADAITRQNHWQLTAEVLLHGVVIAGWALVFGWVSRRFERQADTFAVQHLARQTPANTHIDPESVLTMTLALQSVADTNHLSIHKRSWRHGSIAWRQSYLRSLIGQPIEHPPIDRTVRLIQVVSVLMLVGTIVWEWFHWG